jgi:hypothetical protein
VIRTAPLVALLALLAGCAATESTPGAAVRTRAWLAAPSGHVEVTRGGTPGTGSSLTLRDDLDLEPSAQLELAAEVDAGPIRGAVSWMPLAFEGTERLDQDEVFHGTTYPAGNLVDTDLDLTTWRVAFDGKLHESERTTVRAGLGAYWWTLDMTLRDRDAQISDERKFSRLLPAIVGSGEWKLSERWSAAAAAGFGTIGKGRRLFDLDATARATIDGGGRGGALLVGLRWMRYDLDEDTNVGRISLLGPTLGLEWRW